jgi:hypothetical protein
MSGHMSSRGFLNYGEPGPGKWITLYVRNGHVFLTVAGLRIDTGWGGGRKGPRWQTGSRPGERAYHETPARFLGMKKPRGVSPAGLGKLGDLSI